MARITAAGDAIVITSSQTLEALRTIKRFRPTALMLTEEDRVVFAIAPTTGAGSITQHGACFNGESHCEGKFATITLAFPGGADVKEWIADNLGGALIKLDAIEETLPLVLAAIQEERAAIIESITVA